MVLFCIGLASGDFEDYPRPVSPAQKLAADKFVAALGSGKKDESQALQCFLYALFTQDREDSSRYVFPVYQFLILYSFRKDGHLAKASVITQYISAIVFFGRGTIFKAIVESMERNKRGYFR